MGMAFTALLLLACAQEQALIDFKTDVTRVPNVVMQLSQATGLKLSAGSSLTDEIVCVIAEKKPQKEILDELAFALDAAWVKHGDSYTLDRPTHWPITFRERRAAAAAKSIQACLDRVPRAKELSVEELLAEAARERKERDEKRQMNSERMMNFGLKTPAGVLLDTIIAELTPTGLGRLAEERTVLSNRPNKVQIALPEKLDEAIAKFAQRHNLAAPAMIEGAKSNKHSWGADNPLDGWGELEPSNLKILLVVDVRKQQRIVLKAYQDEKLSAIAYRYLRDPIERSANAASILVPLRERSIRFLRARASLDPDAEPRMSDPNLVAEFSNPSEFDFLEPANTEAMEAIQKREGRALVAVIPDDMLARPFMMDAKGNLNLGMYESMMQFLQLAMDTHNGWTVLKSVKPEHRLSRASLGRTLRRAGQEGRMSLDNWAQAILPLQESSERLHSEICSLLGFAPRQEWWEIPNTIRFYGTLTSQQKAALARDEALTADSLTAAQRFHVQTALFQGDGLIGIVKKSSSLRAYDVERTEIYPLGFSDPCQVSAEHNEGEAYFKVYNAAGGKRTSRSDPSSLAWQEVHIERPDLFPSQGEVAKPLKTASFYKGKELRFNFVFSGDSSFDFGAELHDQVVDLRKPYGWDDLPASLREEVERVKKDLIAQYTKLKQEGRLGTGSGKVPPP